MFPVAVCKKDEMPLGSRLIRLGCAGRDVRALQQELMAAGYLREADGRYGLVTEEAVRKLQLQSRLCRDGVTGPETIAALRRVGKGLGFAIHRVRQGESVEDMAQSLGVTGEVLRRENRLHKKDRIAAGACLRVPIRALLVSAGEELPASIRYSASLGPDLILQSPDECRLVTAKGDLPLLAADLQVWHDCLRRPRAAAESIRRMQKEYPWAHWAVDLPPPLWRKRGRLLGFLETLARIVGTPPYPLVHWPQKKERLPDLASAARLADYLILDPGRLSFDQTATARLIRQVTSLIPARRLIPLFRAEGLLSRGSGEVEMLPVREARATAIAARAKLGWEAGARIYLAVHRDQKDSWELRLLNERGLRERARLIDRLGCAGVVFQGLGQVVLPWSGAWPGEFAVLDNFPAALHID